MKNDVRLGVFITFILLTAVPTNPSVAVSDLIHVQPAMPRLLLLTQFLRIALERIREHEFSRANELAETALILRFGTAE